MIAHQHPCVDQPAVTEASAVQPVEERFLIVVSFKERFAAIAPRHHMIHSAGIFEAGLPCHERKPVEIARFCQCQNPQSKD